MKTLLLFTFTFTVGISSAFAQQITSFTFDEAVEATGAAGSATDSNGKEQMIFVVNMTVKDRFAPIAGEKTYSLQSSTQSGRMLMRMSGEGGRGKSTATFNDLANTDIPFIAVLNPQGLKMARMVPVGNNKFTTIAVGQARSGKSRPFQISKAEMNSKMKERFTGEYSNAVMADMTALVKANVPDIDIKYKQETEYLSGYSCQMVIPTYDLECIFRVQMAFLIGLD